MPNGFGFSWAGHSAGAGYRALAGIPIGPGGAGLFNATEAAVGKLALADGVKLSSVTRPAGTSTAPAGPGGSATERPGQASGTDEVLGIVVLALVAIAGVAFARLHACPAAGLASATAVGAMAVRDCPRAVGGWRFRVERCCSSCWPRPWPSWCGRIRRRRRRRTRWPRIPIWIRVRRSRAWLPISRFQISSGRPSRCTRSAARS